MPRASHTGNVRKICGCAKWKDCSHPFYVWYRAPKGTGKPHAGEALRRPIEKLVGRKPIDYADAKGERSTILMRPAFIRYSAAEHLVLWGIPDEGHWVELGQDRIHLVRDTGQEFSPCW